MIEFRMIKFDDLIRELEKHKFKQLHIHHTWKPTHRNFNGVNHFNIQTSMYNHHTKTNGWSDIGQHLTLFPDGKWLTGRPFNIAPASIKDWNTGALAVEMVGNFDKIGELPYNDLGYDELEGKQKENILKLMKYFLGKYGEQSIVFHREGKGVSKSCPGTSLNKVVMIREANSMGDKKEIKLDQNEPSNWAKDDWQWGIDNKITDGTNPKGNITREQVVAMIRRAREVK